MPIASACPINFPPCKNIHSLFLIIFVPIYHTGQRGTVERSFNSKIMVYLRKFDEIGWYSMPAYDYFEAIKMGASFERFHTVTGDLPYFRGQIFLGRVEEKDILWP